MPKRLANDKKHAVCASVQAVCDEHNVSPVSVAQWIREGYGVDSDPADETEDRAEQTAWPILSVHLPTCVVAWLDNDPVKSRSERAREILADRISWPGDERRVSLYVHPALHAALRKRWGRAATVAANAITAAYIAAKKQEEVA